MQKPRLNAIRTRKMFYKIGGRKNGIQKKIIYYRINQLFMNIIIIYWHTSKYERPEKCNTTKSISHFIDHPPKLTSMIIHQFEYIYICLFNFINAPFETFFGRSYCVTHSFSLSCAIFLNNQWLECA